ncbi:uncharacterized protein N7459_009428 [Penicillium hispanicum]|uniref:uncharacterized protein n=1 Tax=Penicillium hispanicum TaxID=1080232 RepID=UPI002540ED73|nr:uncharacterized protein N7459_009428 [Penicillium hispanicum]KAJ5569998.1 hypothetical protein N7459_009428 [Penicillium hispanicum]
MSEPDIVGRVAQAWLHLFGMLGFSFLISDSGHWHDVPRPPRGISFALEIAAERDMTAQLAYLEKQKALVVVGTLAQRQTRLAKQVEGPSP